MKPLSPALIEQTRDALVSGYRNWAELDQLVGLGLGFDLETEVGGRGGALRNTTYELLKFTESRGLAELLIREAIRRNPGNVKLGELGGELGLAPAPFSRPGQDRYEALVTRHGSSIEALNWREEMVANEQRVCQILLDGRAIGTGFLIAPELVMSNWHVFERASPGGSLGDLANYSARFDFRGDESCAVADPGLTVGCDAAAGYLDSSHKAELDYVIVKLVSALGNGPTGMGKSRGWLGLGSREFELDKAEPALVLQHPAGRTLELAGGAMSGWVEGLEHQVYRHQVKTEGGSSGSPCFSFDWTLLALHHRVDPSGTSNRAIAMSAILARMGNLGTIALLPSI